MTTSTLNPRWEKNLDSVTSLPFPTALSLWPSRGGRSLEWKLLVLVTPRNSRVVECVKRKLLLTLPLDAGDGLPRTALHHPLPFFVKPEPAILALVLSSLAEKSFLSLLLL